MQRVWVIIATTGGMVYSQCLPFNPASGISLQPLLEGLSDYSGATHIIIGSEDPAIKHVNVLENAESLGKLTFMIIEGADHHFSGAHLDTFIELPAKYLF